MAVIKYVNLSIKRDKPKKMVDVTVKVKVFFNSIESCIMQKCEEARFFSVKCSLMDADPGPDRTIYTFDKVFFFPDTDPSTYEYLEFKDSFGESLLDVDLGRDEVYAKAILNNYLTGVKITRISSEVKDWF